MTAIRKCLVIQGRRTSTKLEPEFWAALDAAAADREITRGAMVEVIVGGRQDCHLAPLIRVWCLREVQARAKGIAIELAAAQSGDEAWGYGARGAPS